MRDIDYCDSDYCHKKQPPMRRILFLIKNSGGSVLYALKGKPVSLDVSKLKSENETLYFQMIIWK